MPVKELMSYVEDGADGTSSCMEFLRWFDVSTLVLGVGRS
jgi:hypothetical protein